MRSAQAMLPAQPCERGVAERAELGVRNHGTDPQRNTQTGRLEALEQRRRLRLPHGDEQLVVLAEAEIVETGSDLRPAFPDNLPRLTRRGKTLYLNGLYRHGFLLAPALARRAAQILLEGAWFEEVCDEDPG